MLAYIPTYPTLVRPRSNIDDPDDEIEGRIVDLPKLDRFSSTEGMAFPFGVALLGYLKAPLLTKISLSNWDGALNPEWDFPLVTTLSLSAFREMAVQPGSPAEVTSAPPERPRSLARRQSVSALHTPRRGKFGWPS